MLINIFNPVFETIVFAILFLFFIVISIKKKDGVGLFPMSVTNELKGVAILAVILMHVGYFLAQDTRFLFPLSVFGGVGVDIFLFLSGYGLAISSAKKDLKVWQFYLRRLSKIVVPVWLTLAIFALVDKFFLNISYGWVSLVENFLGFFPTNDIYHDINSPMWFITLILFFYLIFPWLFSKKRPIFSAIIIFAVGWFVVSLKLPVGGGVLSVYKTHIAAFPLGIVLFGILGRSEAIRLVPLKLFQAFSRVISPLKALSQKMMVHKIAISAIESMKKARISYYAGFIFLLAVIIIYTGIYSGVGKGIVITEIISLVTTVAFVLLFLIKKSELGILAFLGKYSFEIYLIHWPLLYRYDIFYKFLPAYLATLLYIILLAILGYVMKLACDRIGLFVGNIFRRKAV